tara:strand:- start:364 stop:750 length:387 start_codon:yes stop_codon:yes gene_type:complete
MAFTGTGEGTVVGYQAGEGQGKATQYSGMAGGALGTGAAALPFVAATGPAAPFVAAALPVVGSIFGSIFGSFFEPDEEPIIAENQELPPMMIPVPQFNLPQAPQMPTLAQQYNVNDPLGFTQDPYGIS